MLGFVIVSENENKRLPLREVFAVVRGDCRDGYSVTTSDENQKYFTIWAVSRSKKYTWAPCKTVFSSSDVNVASRWLNIISEIISQPGISSGLSFQWISSSLCLSSFDLWIFALQCNPLTYFYF